MENWRNQRGMMRTLRPGYNCRRLFLAMDFLEYDGPGEQNTLWYSLRINALTSEEKYPENLTESFNLIINYRSPVTHTNPWYGGGQQRDANVQFHQLKETDQQRDAIAGTKGTARALVKTSITMDTSVYYVLMG